MAPTGVIEQAAAIRSQSRKKAATEYQQLVRDCLDEKADPQRVLEVLDSCGKTEDDLQSDVRVLEERGRDAEVAAKLPKITTALAKIAAQKQALNDEFVERPSMNS